MMSMGTIRAMSDRAATDAARTKKKPYVPFDAAEVDSYPAFPFPFLGGYVPDGWAKVEELFCDSSGFGRSDEPALSVDQLKAKVREYVTKDGTFGFAITEQAQFQASVGVFEYKGTQALRGRRRSPR